MLIVVMLFDPRSDGIASLNDIRWLLGAICVSSSGRIYVVQSSLSIQSQVLGVVASFQGYGGHDDPVVACSATVPVFQSTPAWQGPR